MLNGFLDSQKQTLQFMKSIFEKVVSDEFIGRIENLKVESLPVWGQMNIAQMLAHCLVTYELIYEDKHPAPSGFGKLSLKKFIKGSVVGDKPYKKNGRTAPLFLVSNKRDFLDEKKHLIDFIAKTQCLGAQYFDGKESHSFGELTVAEWNNLFSKHLDHNLTQFGV